MAAIFGPVGGLILVIIGLRFMHFEKAISDLQDQITARTRVIESTLNDEIKKKREVSIERVKELVNMLSALDNKKKSLERLDNRIGSFRFDLISIALIVVILVIGAFAATLDSNTILIIVFMGYFVLLNIYNFANNVQEYRGIKRKLRQEKLE
jgi:hypothetical protein